MDTDEKKVQTGIDVSGEIEKFYDDNLGSPLALLAFVVIVAVLGFSVWIFYSEESRHAIMDFIGLYIPAIKTVFTVITIIWIAGIIYLFIRTREIDNKEYHKYKSINIKTYEKSGHNTQWQGILDHMESDNFAEWRIAILEADAMLDDVIKKAGGVGDTLGERLKSIDPDGFKSLQAAWDAHKVRNMIAHGGPDYQLTRREAKRVIDLYESVFHEFHYI